MKSTLRRVAHRLFPTSKTEQKPSAFDAQKRLVTDARVVFDVGAYIGTVATQYERMYPAADIHCFEPFPESFNQLQSLMRDHPRVHCVPGALGSETGEKAFHANALSVTNSLLATHADGNATWSNRGYLNTQSVVTVPVTTVDEYMQAHQISHIDILKMDVQGAEYLVMQGADDALKRGAIKLVYTEIITMPTYESQLAMDEVLALFRTHGFVLYDFFDPLVNERGQLRQVDAIFVQKDSTI